jgi:hypothetical protein
MRKDITRAHFDDGAILHRGCRPPRDDRPRTGASSCSVEHVGIDMQRPSPAWFVNGTADRHASDPDNLENLPFSNVRTSSGFSNRFSIVWR